MLDLTRNISRNFTLGEFLVTNSAGGTAGLLEDLLALPEAERESVLMNIRAVGNNLQTQVRERFGRPVIITSGWRSRRVNKQVNGASRSQHLIGKAADFVVVGMSPRDVQKALDHCWFGGLGYGRTFTNLDIRPSKVRFNY